MKKLILIDGNSIIHRVFHAIPVTMQTSKGEITNAIFGFSSVLLNILEIEKPDYVVVAMDERKKTFRHEISETYKATRVAAPQELYDQIDRIKEILTVFAIPIYSKEGFEADDVIATVAQKISKSDIQIIIASGDKDLFQLVKGDRVLVKDLQGGYKKSQAFDEGAVLAGQGVRPVQVPDLKGIAGDPSDNIKGVEGIGPKGAVALLQRFGSLENIYNNLDLLPDTQREKLEKSKEQALQSKQLATLIRDVPISFDLERCRFPRFDSEAVIGKFEELEFGSLLQRFKKGLTQKTRGKKPSDDQLSIFDFTA